MSEFICRVPQGWSCSFSPHEIASGDVGLAVAWLSFIVIFLVGVALVVRMTRNG
jgi:hypothetical protein